MSAPETVATKQVKGHSFAADLPPTIIYSLIILPQRSGKYKDQAKNKRLWNGIVSAGQFILTLLKPFIIFLSENLEERRW